MSLNYGDKTFPSRLDVKLVGGIDVKELLEKFKSGEVNIDEVLAKIEEGKKDMIPRARLNEKNEEIKRLKEEIENRDKQIGVLEKSVKGNEELEKQIQELKAKNEDWARKYKETQINTAIKLAAKDAKDPEDVLVFLDKSKLELNEDGSVKGLDEALEGLRASKPYLFDEGPKLKGRTPIMTGNTVEHTGKNPWSKESFNLTEQARIMKENPELAQKLKEQARG